MLYAYKLKMNSSYSPALLKGGPESQQRRNCSPIGTSLGGILGVLPLQGRGFPGSSAGEDSACSVGDLG